MKVLLPENHKSERQYATEVLLVEWLGLSVDIQFSKSTHSPEIILDNGNHLLFEDHFFGRFMDEHSYLQQENIPSTISWESKSRNQFLAEADIPIVFGNKHLDISTRAITCGIDIFASTFFMLSRWEEYVLTDRDGHGRLPAEASLAGRHNFLHRPIVNEYLEMLWNMLVHLGFDHPRKKHHFKPLITHDVDLPLLWPNWFSVLKKAGGDMLKRFNPKEFVFSLISGIRTKTGFGKDPFDSFDFLMDISDRAGLQSHFFFLCGDETEHDDSLPLNTPFMRQLIQNIQERGHVIGLHPSYNTIENADMLKSEKQALEKATGFAVRFGRQHFLRFQVPGTWQMWEDAGMEWDSSMYYPEQAGFRCGTCHPFPVFNILTRKKLRLKEVPLTAMEVTWKKYLKATPEKMLGDMLSLLETVKKYQGTFVLLWHNSSFNTPEWKRFGGVYDNLLEKI
ncbi:MAG: polysaccharide deacetylase family protein [Saprospiraceae bacterium]